jgi:hypothetical protein
VPTDAATDANGGSAGAAGAAGSGGTGGSAGAVSPDGGPEADAPIDGGGEVVPDGPLGEGAADATGDGADSTPD